MRPPFLLDQSAVSGGEEGRGTRSAPAGRRTTAFFMLLMLNLQSALGKLSFIIHLHGGRFESQFLKSLFFSHLDK